jgi:hypothetical protein
MAETNNCVRCQIATGKFEQPFNVYEWYLEQYDQTIFWNVTEVRRRLAERGSSLRASVAAPYPEQFIGMVNAHDVRSEHITHIPIESIQPSLVANLTIPNKITGESEIFSVMLDGHHSALSCISRGVPVEVEVVPSELLIEMMRADLPSMLAESTPNEPGVGIYVEL